MSAARVRRLGEARHRSPLPLGGPAGGRFVADDARLRAETEVRAGAEAADDELLFELSGPRERLFFDPPRFRAAIVTCGGLCPGLNNVIRSLFLELHFNYGAREVLGLRYGYRGLIPAYGHDPLVLTPEMVDDIHTEGGTLLGTSRGPQDVGAMVDFLRERSIDALFCVGGDGTLRGAHAIHEEIARRGMPIAVIGIPKTIDNDILWCSRTFGFFTAVDVAREVVRAAHNEARSALGGVGIVKLMGRDSGFIAAGATLASQDVNFALVPEVRFALEGPRGLLAALERRLRDRGHAIIVVAEGAGQDLFGDLPRERDASGNLRHHDIGPFLKQHIQCYMAERSLPVDVKYIDPSYVIRSTPANMADSLLCDWLARDAAHAAMAGRTDVMVGYWSGRGIHVPIPLATAERKRIDPDGEVWERVLATTGQPRQLF